MKELIEYSQTKFAEMIGQRRSIRRYIQSPIDAEAIDRILIAATLAPSAHNRQPWRFAILEDTVSKNRLATAMAQRLRQDRSADGDDPDDIERDAARSYLRITEAPLVIVVSLNTCHMDRYPDQRRRKAEYLMAVQSTAMAVQNLLLAAHGEGLGACIMCAPLFCADTVADALQLPAGWEAQSLVTIGVPVNPGKTRPRLSLAKIVWRPTCSAVRTG